MPVIDADAHVVESEHTWEYMDPSDRKYRPYISSSPVNGSERWVIDGQLRRSAKQVITDEQFKDLEQKTGRKLATTLETRGMENVEVRLKALDELGIDIQILFPTMFLEQISDRAEVEVPICLSYNRWLADIWKQGKGRLRWICVLPLLSIPDAIDQLRYSKENGAVGVFWRCIEGERLPVDPYFYPLYEEISRLDMCVAMHVGLGNPYMANLLRQRAAQAGAFWTMFLNTAGALHTIISTRLMTQFPKLRFGFLEAGADWLPYLLKNLKRQPWEATLPKMQDILREDRLYVAVHAGDDVPYIIRHAGEDNLVIGTDYGHTDTNSDLHMLKKLAEQEEMSAEAARKIVDDNPGRLYGL